MDKLFASDINNILMEFVSTKEMFDLKKIISDMKLTDNMIKKKFIRNINSRLTKVFGNNVDVFKKFLEDTQSFISGSFIMQCILEEEYLDSDIDIYTTNKKNIVDFHNLKIASTYGIGHYMKVDDSKDIQYYGDSAYDLMPNVLFNVCDYYVGGHDHKIQFIIADSPHNIVNNFDMDICKNIYGVDNEKEYLNIYNMDQLFEKKSVMRFVPKEVDEKTNIHRYMRRYYKYVNRGYNLEKNIHESINSGNIKQYITTSLIIFVKFISENSNSLKIKYTGDKMKNCKFSTSSKSKFCCVHPHCRFCSLPKRHGERVFLANDLSDVYFIKKHNCLSIKQSMCKCTCYKTDDVRSHLDEDHESECNYNNDALKCQHTFGNICECKCDCKSKCKCQCRSYIFNCDNPRKCALHFLDIKHIHCDNATTIVVEE